MRVRPVVFFFSVPFLLSSTRSPCVSYNNCYCYSTRAEDDDACVFIYTTITPTVGPQLYRVRHRCWLVRRRIFATNTPRVPGVTRTHVCLSTQPSLRNGIRTGCTSSLSRTATMVRQSSSSGRDRSTAVSCPCPLRTV